MAASGLLGKRTLERQDPLALSFWMFTVAAVFWSIVRPWWAFDPGVLTEKAPLLGHLGQFELPVWMPLVWVMVAGAVLVQMRRHRVMLSGPEPLFTEFIDLITSRAEPRADRT